MPTVTVTRYGKQGRVKTTFSRLPGQAFGPYDWPEAVRDLTVSALLPRLDARNLVLDALANGQATTETN